MGRFGTIIQIGDILVSEDVALEYFACDYEACRGICCIEGDSGAPVDESELEGLEADYLVLDENPASSVEVLYNHDSIKQVVLNGKTVVKNGLLMW